jgi:hypothetical protein
MLIEMIKLGFIALIGLKSPVCGLVRDSRTTVDCCKNAWLIKIKMP